MGLRLPKGVGAASLKVYCNSQLVVNQVKGEYAAKGENMKVYLKEAKALAGSLADFQIEAIPKEFNQEVDDLNKYVWQVIPLHVHFVENVLQLVAQECTNANYVVAWATPIQTYIKSKELPGDEVEARRIR